MAGKSDAWENGLLNLLFNNQAFANVGDASGLQPSSVTGSLYVSLHTADPGDAGDQTTNETAYTDYARVAVGRTTAGWDAATTGVTVPAADIDFPECGATPGAAVGWFGIGVSGALGATALVYSGALNPSITMATGVIPRIKATSTITET